MCHDIDERLSEGEDIYAPKQGHHDQMRKDIGYTDIKERAMKGDLASDQQTFLRDIHRIIGNSQVSIMLMKSAPSWVTNKDLDDGHNNNWQTVYYEVKASYVPKNANIISSHVVYNVKL